MARWALDPDGMALIERLRHEPSVKGVEELGKIGKSAAIPYLAQMLPGKDKKMTAATLDAIDRLLSELQPSDLRRLDQEIRTRWFYSDWAPNMKPKDVAKLVMKFEHPLAAAATASMHRSGYIREEAIRRLARLQTGAELPYLLIRAADWVDQVRGAAQRAIEDRLIPEYIEMFIRNLVLLEGGSFETGRASSLAPMIEKFLISPEASSLLIKGLRNPDRGVRRAASRRALRAGIQATTLLEDALDQDDVVVAQMIVRASIEEASDQQRDSLLHRLDAHPFGRIRQMALMARLRYFPESAVNVLNVALFDRQAGVRDIAQRELTRRGEDVARLYRDVLVTTPHIALLGLGETGVKEDAGLATPFVTAPETKVRRAATRAIALLDPANSRAVLIRALQDQSPSVSRAATQGLDRAGASVIAPELWEILRSTEYAHHRKYCVTLLTHGDRWTMLGLGLQALLEPSDDVKLAGQQLIGVCMATWNKSFTGPTPGTIESLRARLEEARPWLTPTQMHDIGFTLRSFNEPKPVREVRTRKV